MLLGALMGLGSPLPIAAQTARGELEIPPSEGTPGRISLAVDKVEITEVMNLLSRKERTNILLSSDVTGTVSINLFDMTLDQAIRAIATAGGYQVELVDGVYFVRKPPADKEGEKPLPPITMRSFKIQYSPTEVVESVLQEYLSERGKIKALPRRQLLLVADEPEYVARIAKLLEEVDRQPRQILIEAQILEITLDKSETFGVDWTRLFETGGGTGAFGTRGLSVPGSSGFFFELLRPDIEVFLDALRARGRVRTLSTPRLMAMENQEASVIVGDRQGFKLTTTINQVTTESIEFLESGVILRVTPAVDDKGRIRLEIHPEVSTGTVSDGIPSQTTTEVTTNVLVPDGNTVFIAGLIRNSLTETRDGVPVLGDIPGIGLLFSRQEEISVNVETVVLITPRVVGEDFSRRVAGAADPEAEMRLVQEQEEVLEQRSLQIDADLGEPTLRHPFPDGAGQN
jgi:type II secretory pathway component GspD/PulD (secretin)